MEAESIAPPVSPPVTTGAKNRLCPLPRMILFCDVSVQDRAGEVNADDFKMNMVLLKT